MTLRLLQDGCEPRSQNHITITHRFIVAWAATARLHILYQMIQSIMIEDEQDYIPYVA